MLLADDYNVRVITQSWLNEKNVDAELYINKYFDMCRNGRVGVRDGEVLIGVSKRLNAYICKSLKIDN